MIAARVLSPPGAWGLAHARRAAGIVLEHPREAATLVRALFAQDAEVRRHAADALRRVTENDPGLLQPQAERVLGALGASMDDDWRMLTHTGLVAARIAHTRAQQLRAAGLLRPLLDHQSNVVRCTALEGLGLLASRVPELQAGIVPVLEDAVLRGTPGMRCRALAALARLRRDQRAKWLYHYAFTCIFIHLDGPSSSRHTHVGVLDVSSGPGG